MKTRNIEITINEAKEWYNSNNDSLKRIALKAFREEELKHEEFYNIKSLGDACRALDIPYNDAIKVFESTSYIGKASIAMFKLNIIRRALNLGYDLHLTEDSDDYLYYPRNPFVTKDSTYFESDINSGSMQVIGRIKDEKFSYNVLGGKAYAGNKKNLGDFDSYNGVGHASPVTGFLGCATREIAEHFGKYFGMLIIEAMYGDLPGFTIIEEKYHHL